MWIPDLDPKHGALYRQVLEALEHDVSTGALAPGAKLPPQRLLAHRLGVSIGAVTRAYSEAERMGLVQGHVGRGTFVAGRMTDAGPFAVRPPAESGLIDLARNRPPPGPSTAQLADAFAAAAREPSLGRLLDYPPPAGLDEHRETIGRWLADLCGAPTEGGERLILSSGAQQAMGLALASVCRPGDTILCEGVTYGGVKGLAEQGGYRICGLALDDEGLSPNALEHALQKGMGRVLYLVPTLQNPTARIMGADRRRAVAELCRRYDAWIVEDDVYASYAAPGERPAPLASFAPERTLYVNGASKSLAPGLRVGALLAPTDELFERALRIVRAQTYTPPSFGAHILTRWIADGTATAVSKRLREELRARVELTVRMLGEAVEKPGARASLQLWMPMRELEAERVAGRCLRAGVEVTPPSVPMTPGGGMAGIRLCLGSPADRKTLTAALEVVKTALSSEVGERSASFI